MLRDKIRELAGSRLENVFFPNMFISVKVGSAAGVCLALQEALASCRHCIQAILWFHLPSLFPESLGRDGLGRSPCEDVAHIAKERRHSHMDLTGPLWSWEENTLNPIIKDSQALMRSLSSLSLGLWLPGLFDKQKDCTAILPIEVNLLVINQSCYRDLILEEFGGIKRGKCGEERADIMKKM